MRQNIALAGSGGFEPHPAQQRIYDSLARFNIARCGRRFGKTVLGGDYLWTGKRGIAAGYPCAWFAPNYKYLSDPWREIKEALDPYIRKKDEVERRLDFWNGGSLEMWTCDGEDPARGRKYAKVVIDEAAMIRKLKDKWQKAIRPTLTDFRGGALFCTTPKGRNDLHALEQSALELDPAGERVRPNWAVHHFPTSANPYIDAEEIEEARRDLPDLVFRQEYLAEYVDFGGALIKPDWLQHGSPDFNYPIIMGVDLAISTKTSADYTAIALLTRDKLGRIYVLAVLRFRVTFKEILRHIEATAATYKPVSIFIEDNQFQVAVVQELLRTTSLPVRGIRRDKDKLTAFMPMASRYEHGLVYHAPTLPSYFIEELLAFTGGPDDGHDDCIDAVANAYAGLPHLGSSIDLGGKTETSSLFGATT